MKYASVIVLCVFAAVSFGSAVSVTYDTADTMQPNPWQDTWVWTGNGPYGSSTELRINTETTYDQRPVLEWDLEDIENATINSAIFYVYRYDGWSSGTLDADIYRVTEYWEEATLVAPAPTYDDSTVWATGDAGQPSGWKTFDITDLVQGWVDGDFDNYGIICLGQGAAYYQRWYSKESGTNKPYLDIDYEEGEPDVTPPWVEDLDPDDGDVDVPLDSEIIFHCKDDASGVDTSTIDFTVQDTTLRGDRMVSASAALGIHASPARTLPGDLDIDDTDPLDVVCTWTGADDFYEDETITCTVDGGLADNKENEMGDDFVWTFDTWVAVEGTTWGAIKADF